MKIKLSHKKRLELITKLSLGEEGVFSLAKEYKVSRTLVYRLRNRHKVSPALLVPGARQKRKSYLPVEVETDIVELALNYPELSSHKLTQLIKGRIKLGSHGVYNLLKRFGLNTYPARSELSRKFLERNKVPVTEKGYLYHEKR